MEEKHEGTPNPLNPNLDADTQNVEDQVGTEKQAEVNSQPDTGGFVPPVELFEPAPEAKSEVEETEPETKETEPEIEDAEPGKIKVTTPEAEPEDKPRKINITEPTEKPEQKTERPQAAPAETREPADKPVVEPTSEESAYQPPQEVKTPAKPKEKSFDIPKNTPEEDDGFLSMHGPESAKPAQAFRAARPAQTFDMVRPAQPKPAAPATSPSMDALGMTAGGFVSSQPNLDPTNRPMERAPIAEAPQRKKKHTGLIIGLIISLFVAVGCGVAAVLIAMNNNKKEDTVAIAASRIVNGEAPTNMAVDGTITIDTSKTSSDIAKMEIAIKSEVVRDSLINSTSAALNVEYRNGDEASLSLDEIYAANGDLYLKIDGVNSLLTDNNAAGEATPTEETSTEVAEVTECAEGDTECVTTTEAITETSDGAAEILAALEALNMIDGEWLRVPVDSFGAILPEEGAQNELICAAQFVSGMNSNNNSFAGVYNQYPFVGSTDEGLAVVAREDPIYLMLIDSEGFNNFVNETQNLAVMKDLATCLGYKNAKIDADDLTETMEKMPAVYVEVNEDYNFTRLYFETQVAMGDDDCCPKGAQCIQGCDVDKQTIADVTVDLNFDYPTNVNVPEPTEYKNLMDVLQQLTFELYGEGEEAEAQQ